MIERVSWFQGGSDGADKQASGQARDWASKLAWRRQRWSQQARKWTSKRLSKRVGFKEAAVKRTSKRASKRLSEWFGLKEAAMDREMEWRAGRQRKEVPKFHAGLSYARISQLSRNCFNKSEEIFLSFFITLTVAHRETPFEKKKNRRKKTFLVANVGIPHHLPPTFISFFLFLSLSLALSLSLSLSFSLSLSVARGAGPL